MCMKQPPSLSNYSPIVNQPTIPRSSPMDEQTLCFLSSAELGRLFRSRALSPVEATQTVLARLRRLDPQLNSFITVLEEQALVQARQAEAELAQGIDRGPLHGVPISLKDLI